MTSITINIPLELLVKLESRVTQRIGNATNRSQVACELLQKGIAYEVLIVAQEEEKKKNKEICVIGMK